MNASELKYQIESRNTKTHFFDRKTMKFFGDTMRNYGVRKAMMKRYSGETVDCWELYRKNAVKYGNRASAYFHAETFEAIFGEVVSV